MPVDLPPALMVVGVACLAIAALVAVVRPFENWRDTALRLAGVGVALGVIGLVVRLLA